MEISGVALFSRLGHESMSVPGNGAASGLMEIFDHHQVRAVAHTLAEKDGLAIRGHGEAIRQISFDLRQQPARIAGELVELERVLSIVVSPANIVNPILNRRKRSHGDPGQHLPLRAAGQRFGEKR